MPVTTIRPNADVAASAFADPYPSGTRAGVTSDNGDGTYVILSVPDYWFVLDLGTYTVPATEVIARVRTRIRWQSSGNGYSGFGYQLVDPTGNAATPDTVFEKRVGVFGTDTGGWRTTAPDGGPWTQAKLDALRLRVYATSQNIISQTPGEGSTGTFIAELYVDVETNARPSVAVTAPANGSTIVDNQQPTVTATYTDADNDPLSGYEMRVYGDWAYSRSGFDPTYDAGADFDSGIVDMAPAASVSVKMPTLANGTYRAYVRLRQGGNVVSQWSNWAYSQFVLNVTAPTTPTFTVTHDTGAQAAFLTVTDAGPAFVAGEVRRIEIERWTPEAVWEPLSRTLPTYVTDYSYTVQGATFTGRDYELRRGFGVMYRARVRREFASGAVTVSAWRTAANSIVIPPAGWILRRLGYAGWALDLNVHSESIESSNEERLGVFRPLGRRNPVVISDVVGGEMFALELAFLTDEEFQVFERLRGFRETLLLQSPYGHHAYVHIGPSRSAAFMPHPSGIPKRIVKTSFVEVDAP